MKAKWIGIDPGKRGAIAVVGEEPDPAGAAMVMPLRDDDLVDVDAIIGWMNRQIPDGGFVAAGAAIEQAQAFPAKDEDGKPKQGVVGMFNYGRGYGQLIGMFQTMDLPFALVAPRTWKRSVFVFEQKVDKTTACDYVHDNYPGVGLFPGRARKPHDGIAEAVCIAVWCRDHSQFRRNLDGTLGAPAPMRAAADEAVPIDQHKEDDMTTEPEDQSNAGDNRPLEEQFEEALREMRTFDQQSAEAKAGRSAVRKRMKKDLNLQMRAVDDGLELEKRIHANGEDYETEYMDTLSMVVGVAKRLRQDPQGDMLNQ